MDEDDFDKKVERLTALRDSMQLYHLHLDAQAVDDITTTVYRSEGQAFWNLVDSLTFEVRPFVKLIDRQSLHDDERTAVWAGFGNQYLARLFVVHSDHDSSNDYDDYLAKLSTEQDAALPGKASYSADRPLSTPSLGTLTVYVTHVVWDSLSVAFAVEYGGSFRGLGDQRIIISQKREENLHLLAGTWDRSRSAEDLGADLIRRWRSGDDSKGKIGVMGFFGVGTQLSGDLRPVLHAKHLQTQLQRSQVSLMPPAKMYKLDPADDSDFSSTPLHKALTPPTRYSSSSRTDITPQLAISLPTITTVANNPVTNSPRFTNGALVDATSTILEDGATTNDNHAPNISQPASPETPITPANLADTLSSTSPARLLPRTSTASTKPEHSNPQETVRLRQPISFRKWILGWLCSSK